jgi:hypothetical protein
LKRNRVEGGTIMGHNIDLVTLVGLPKYEKCPNCGREVDSNFEEFDIDAQECIKSILQEYECSECDCWFQKRYVIKIEKGVK